MAEGNLPTRVLQRFPLNHTVVANEVTGITGLALNAAGNVTAVATDALAFAESDLPVPLPAAGTVTLVTAAFDGLIQGVAAAAIAVGARLTITTGGQVVTAVAGQFVIGRAMSATTAAGQRLQIFITREGNA